LIEDPEIIRIEATKLESNYLDLKANLGIQAIEFLSK